MVYPSQCHKQSHGRQTDYPDHIQSISVWLGDSWEYEQRGERAESEVKGMGALSWEGNGWLPALLEDHQADKKATKDFQDKLAMNQPAGI